MTSDEGMMCAARVMRDAAELNQRAADRIEEAVRQMQILFDAGYGGTAPRLLEELEKANATDGNWNTGCQEIHVFISGTPQKNGYVYCPYCGGKIENEGGK
jgi:hypothetical protein